MSFTVKVNMLISLMLLFILFLFFSVCIYFILFLFYFIFKFYIIVLVLPNIKMNLQLLFFFKEVIMSQDEQWCVGRNPFSLGLCHGEALGAF